MKKLLVLLAVAAVAFSSSTCVGPAEQTNAVPVPAPTAEAAQPAAASTQMGMRSLRIAIDPGHGGIDHGAIGTDTGVYESSLNLEISQLIAKRFILGGADVLMTRKSADVDYTGDGDTLKRKDMNSRARLIAAQNPQLIVSIHMNKYPNRKLYGAQVFYEKGSAEGEKLAACIQDALNSGLDDNKKRSAKPGDYFILKVSASPSVIVECGFLSNHSEEKKLLDPAYREKMADCIYKGICKYMGIQ
jgi:N-acetylmuramoyl-L-alanine amidase